jgi:orotate phosphoribosyltransferase-like protein
MDYSNATGPKPDLRVRRGVEQGGIDQVAALMARKMSAGNIAKELDIPVQKATWMMAGVRKRRTPDELDIALKAKLWG